MSSLKDQVRKNAKAFVDTLEKLTAKERGKTPMADYAREINKLIELAKEADPNVDPRLWPEPIQIQDAGYGVEQVFGTFESVMTAARRIVANLPQGFVSTTI